MARRPGSGRARLLVLGAGPAQLGLLEAAAARDDVHVIAVDRDPEAVGLPLADERAILSTEDEEGIDRLARALDIDGLVSPGADWPVGIAARVAARLGLPHPIDAATGAVATSKLRQRERFATADVPHAAAVEGRDAELLARLPVVVKAPDRQGQRGLTLVSRAEELGPALALAREEARGGTVLVEEVVDGPEVTVNAVSVAGRFVPLLVTDRVTAEAPAFGVALAHVWPSEAVSSVAAGEGEVVSLVRRAVEAVGIADGPSYTQVRLSPSGPVVMEVAARLGGGHDAELVRAVTGVDLAGLAVSFALGEAVRPPVVGGWADLDVPPAAAVEQGAPGEGAGGAPRAATVVGGGCVRFLVPPVGALREARGVAEAARVPGVAWVRVYRRPGHVFVPLRRGADRAGAVLATGASRAEALERAATAAARVQLDVRP